MAAYERRRRRVRPPSDPAEGTPPDLAEDPPSDVVEGPPADPADGLPAEAPAAEPAAAGASVAAGRAPTPATAMHPSTPVSPAAVRPTSPGAAGSASPAAARGARVGGRGPGGGVPPAGGEEREGERGLRGLVGSGSSQVSVGAALRARDAARPSDEHLAEAEERLTIVRRNWVPREDLPRR